MPSNGAHFWIKSLSDLFYGMMKEKISRQVTDLYNKIMIVFY